MSVEEDGDEVFTPMTHCYRWECQEWDKSIPVYPTLVPRKVWGTTFMCCPKCGGSYGEQPKVNS